MLRPYVFEGHRRFCESRDEVEDEKGVGLFLNNWLYIYIYISNNQLYHAKWSMTENSNDIWNIYVDQYYDLKF